MSTSSSDESTLSERARKAVVEAAELVRHCDGLWRDQRDRQEKWEIDYAVDNDIINLYLNAATHSPYAQVFSGDESSQTEESLAELLGHYVVGRPRAQVEMPGSIQALGQLFIIAPHDEELDRTKLAIARAVQEQAALMAPDLDAVVADLAAGIRQGDETVLQRVARRLTENQSLTELLDGLSGPRRELSRFVALPRRRLTNLSRSPHYSRINAHGVVDRQQERILPPGLDGDPRDVSEFHESILRWDERLKAHRVGAPQKGYARRDDAEVLASLEWINRRTTRHKRRLVLITGSPNLFAAASTVRSAEDGSMSFARAYLRDPRAFLAADDFFAPPDASGGPASGTTEPAAAARGGFQLDEWLNLFFPGLLKRSKGETDTDFGSLKASTAIRVLAAWEDFPRQDVADHPVVAEIVERVLQSAHQQVPATDFQKELVQEWSDIVRSTFALQHVAPEPDELWARRAQEVVSSLNARLKSGITLIALRAELQLRIDRSLQALYFSTGEVGIMQLMRSGAPLRGVPTLRFSSRYPEAQDQCELLCLQLWRGESRFNLEEMYHRLDRDDPSKYQAHLIHALAYAARGHWFATQTLCRLAFSIARDEQAPSARDGREAAYLQAVAERRMARTVGDLLSAQKRLEVARACKPEDGQVGEDIRFRSEAFAAKTTLAQFGWFDTPPLPPPALPALLEEAESIVAAIDTSGPVSIQKWVVRQTVTNASILCLLHRLSGSGQADPAPPALLRLLDALKAHKLTPAPFAPTGVSKFHDAVSNFVYLVSVATFSPHAQDRLEARKALQEPIDLGGPPLPFEANRKKAFLGLAQQETPSP